MAQTSRLVLEIDSRDAEKKAADTKKALGELEDQGLLINPALSKASRSIQQLGDNAQATAPQIRGMERQFRSLAAMASGLVAPLAAAFSITKISQAAAEYTNITNRLRLVTEGSQQLSKAQNDVFQVAQNSRQALESTAQVYQRIAQNGKQLGLSLDRVASITETVAKSVALSGASAQAADAALVQFGQALASGTLRGDELNSIMEQTPALAQAIARGLGVTIGQLRTMGAEGKLTSESVVRALESQKNKVDELSASMSVTAGQAMTAFNNSLTVTVGKLDEATTASSKFAKGLLALSEGMDRFNSGEFLDFFRDDKQTVAGLNNELSVIMSEMRDLADIRAKLIKGKAGDTAFYNFKFYDVDELDKSIADLQKKADGITEIRNRMQKSAADLGAQQPAGDAPGAVVNPAYEKMLESLKKQAALQGENTEASKVRYAIESGELGKLLPAQQQLLLQYAKEKDAKASAEEAAKKAAQTSEHARNATQRAFDTASEDYQRQIQLINVTTDKQKEASEATKLAFELESGKLAGLTQQQKAYLRGKADELDALKKIQAANEADAKFNAFLSAQESQTLTQKNGYDMDLAGLGSSDKTRERLQQEMQIRQQYESDLKALAAQRTSGDITQNDYARQTEALREQLALRLVNQRDYYNQLDKAQSDWSLGASSAFQTYADEAADVAGQTRNLFTNAFSNMEDGIIQFVKTGKLSFKDLADGIIADLIRIQVRLAAVGIFGTLFSGLAGAGASAAGNGLAAGSAGAASSSLGASAAGYTSKFGFSDGGYTGDGGKFEPKGVVHGGEFVVRKDVVSQPGAREFLERMNANSKGYADGGYVGPAAAASTSAVQGGVSGGVSLPPVIQHITVGGNVDAATVADVKRGSEEGAKAAYQAVLADLKRNGPISQLISRKR
ncbi:phage tail tape measure protein [Pseudomonas sp. MRSN 12121]|uniref:phage tail tape measure protein n=1 Tax=Pseudomonas sp. MRSN 12121 TaxID=1611770 RepID=UPI000698980C|nr:phage tail tape measure protein [Pseudomonas sp. MRSN 12121]